MKKLLVIPVICLALLASLPMEAVAHPGHEHEVANFASGFFHPLAGLDHILAMVAVGLFAWHLGGRALWLVPAAFVGTMAFGGVLGAMGAALPMVELGIALSIVVVGALIASWVRMPTVLAMAIVGLFALFHGHAHGAEMAADGSGLAYGLGFMLATAMLHGVGIVSGIALGQLGASRGMQVARASGAAIALAGVLILTGIV